MHNSGVTFRLMKCRSDLYRTDWEDNRAKRVVSPDRIDRSVKKPPFATEIVEANIWFSIHNVVTTSSETNQLSLVFSIDPPNQQNRAVVPVNEKHSRITTKNKPDSVADRQHSQPFVDGAGTVIVA